MESGVTKVDLNTLCGGVLPELFEREFQNVVRNIKDVNTEELAKRKVVMEVTVEPQKETNRTKACLSLSVKSKLAPVKPVVSGMLIEGRDAYEQEIVPSANPELSNVTDMPGVQ